jgi:uncharacterized protein (DUF4213/DUF364 family)
MYDRLIAGVPTGIKVIGWNLGRRWSCVVSDVGTGIAMTVGGGAGIGKGSDFLGGDAAISKGFQLHEMAAFVKSWRFEEASIGIAALNAWYNSKENNPLLASCVADTSGQPQPDGSRTRRQSDIIAAEIGEQEGKKVTVIGHFPHLEDHAQHCELTILERSPSDGDLPDTACEYVLPSQDLVIITGTAATNKTLPRLLTLSKGARVAIVGPSAICSEVFFDYGADIIGGAMVTDTLKARILISHGVQLPFGHGVEMVCFQP